MKVRSLSSIVLLTALVAGIAVPTAANAEDTTTTSPNALSNGFVKVEAGQANPKDPIIDPDNPDKGPDIDPSTPGIHPGGTGSLAITNTTDLQFGTISTGNAVINKYADGLSLVDADKKPTGEKRGALVAWSDMRGTNAGYTITAAMTQQFTLAEDTKTIGGATVTYTNPLLETKSINADIAPALDAKASSFTLGEDGNAVTVVNAKTGTGAGTYVLEFGHSATYDPANAVIGPKDIADKGTDTTGSSVNLTVPQATAASMTLGDYTATITWSIVAAPTTPTTPDTPAGA